MKHIYTIKNASAAVTCLFRLSYQFVTLLLFLSFFLIGNRAVLAQSTKGNQPEKVFMIESISPVIGCPGTIISVVPKNSNDKKVLFTAAASYTLTFSAKISSKTHTYATVVATYESSTLLKAELPKLLKNGTEIANGSLVDITVTQTLNGQSVSDIKQDAFTYQVDNTKPVIAATPTIKANTDPGYCSASVALMAPAASDNCSEAIVTSNLASLNLQVINNKVIFPKGSTTIIWTASDGSGNTATSEQIVTVSDNQSPVFKVSPLPVLSLNMDLEACSATVELTAPEASDNCEIVSIIHNLQVQGKATFQKGITKIIWTAADASGNTATIEQEVEVKDNQNPSITIQASVINVVAEADLCSAVVGLDSPLVSDNCGIASTVGSRSDAQVLNAPFPVGTTTITYTATDVNGNQAQAQQLVIVKDIQKPVISGIPSDINVVNDAGKCSAIIMWATPIATDNCSIVSFTSNIASGNEFTVGEHTVVYTAVDASGNEQKAGFKVTVTNQAPQVKLISAPVEPVHIANAVFVNVSFDDTNLSGATLNWGDGKTSYYGIDNVINSQDLLTLNQELLSGNHIYASPGFYKITVTLTDACSATSAIAEYEYVMVYDPNSGFVTGGGWFESPKGAYTPLNTTDEDVTGKATYSFVAKYKGSSLVEGNTQFHFAAGNIKFKSSSYEPMRLIISGGEVNYKGKGTINGEGEYEFLLTATDGQFEGGSGPDKVRMKIWNVETKELVYDNHYGAGDAALTATVIGGGSIVVHKFESESNKTETAGTVAFKEETAQVTAYPNPFADKLILSFDKAVKEQVVITILDMQGAAVYQKTFKAIDNDFKVELDLSGLQLGIYYLQSVQGTDMKVNRIVKL